MNSAITIFVASALLSAPVLAAEKPRARDLGIAPGVLAPGKLNAITDIRGVKVVQVTVVVRLVKHREHNLSLT